MEQRVSLVTLGVEDLERATSFYDRLGWRPANDWREQGVAFFQCGGSVVALWARTALADDADTPAAGPPAGVTLAHNVRTPAEVDDVIEQARTAGARVVRDGAPTAWGGLAGMFHDLDGHAWEVAHNPAWTIGEDGSIRID